MKPRRSKGIRLHYDSKMTHRRLNLGQRIVLIVALGALLEVCGSWFTSSGPIISRDLISPFYSADTGAFATSGFSSNSHTHFLVWFALIAVWTAASMFLLRGRTERDVNRPDSDGEPTGDD